MFNIKPERDPIYLDWKDNCIVCAGCGTRQELKIPISLDKAAKTMDEFKVKHNGCNEKGGKS